MVSLRDWSQPQYREQRKINAGAAGLWGFARGRGRLVGIHSLALSRFELVWRGGVVLFRRRNRDSVLANARRWKRASLFAWHNPRLGRA